MNVIMHSATMGLGSLISFLHVGVCALLGLNIYVNKVFLQPPGPRLPLKPKRDSCSDGVSTGPCWEATL